MNISLRQLVISIVALCIALATVVYIAQNAASIGDQPLFIRALILSTAVTAVLVAIYPFSPLFSGRPGRYGLVVGLPALLPGLVYYLYLLPAQAGEGVTARQIQSQLITDSSSSGRHQS